MSRFLDLILVLAGLFMILAVQTSAAIMLDPMRDELLDEGIDDKYNAEENFADMYRAVTKWVPTIAGVGLMCVAGFREYRRQRLTAATPPGRRL